MTTDVAFANAADGAQIAYRKTMQGGGRRYLLIHSLAMDASVWDGVTPLLDGDVVAVDCRGHGRSTRAAGPYTPDQFAADVAAVMDAVGWSDAIVAGCSMGGCVAQAFAARYPERTRALALIDTTAWYGANAPTEWRGRAETARRDGLASMAKFQTTRWFGDRFRAENPDKVESAMAVFTANDIDCYAATCVMLGDADLRPELPRFTMPVAIAVGEEDYATPVASAQAMADAITGATMTVLPGGRHLTPIECPEKIAGILRGLAA